MMKWPRPVNFLATIEHIPALFAAVLEVLHNCIALKDRIKAHPKAVHMSRNAYSLQCDEPRGWIATFGYQQEQPKLVKRKPNFLALTFATCSSGSSHSSFVSVLLIADFGRSTYNEDFWYVCVLRCKQNRRPCVFYTFNKLWHPNCSINVLRA